MKNFRLLPLLSCLLVVTLLIPCAVHAVPAAPGVHTLTHPDGTTIRARQWGDENLNGWETEDGFTIIRDEDFHRWTYAEHAADGRLVSSAKTVGTDRLPQGWSKRLRPAGQAAVRMERRRLARESKQRLVIPQGFAEGLTPYAVAPTGTGNIPVILMNFSNTTATYAPAAFDALLFGTGNNSMKDYYEEVSYGAFTVSAGPGGVAGWYTAANKHNDYGQNDAYGNDRWPGDLVYEAVAAADAAGFDFTPYDQDGDCYVDIVTIIHQGTGEEAGGPSTDIWSHRWNLTGASHAGYSHYGAYTTNDTCAANPSLKVRVNDYAIQPELLWGEQQTMGVFAHEYGHALGLPDLYDTDGSSEGIGDWSLMAGGSWNSVARAGDRPAHPDSWCKYYLGWVAPTEVTVPLTNEPIAQIATAPEVYKLLSGNPLSGEYFLVENRQKTGFDAGLPGSGLLIWHIDGNAIAAKMFSNSVNNYECYPGGPDCGTDRYGVKLVQADNFWQMEKNLNRGNPGDTYKAGGNVTFNGISSPSSNLYDANLSNVIVTDISASGVVMTATLSIGSVVDTTPPAGMLSINSGASYAGTADVTLMLSALDPSGVTEMCISNAASCDAWEAYATSKAWTLAEGADGSRTVYAWFRDSLNNENTNPYTDTIILDTLPPAAGSVSTDPTEGSIILSWAGFHDLSGISGYSVVYDTAGIPASCSEGVQIYAGSSTSYMHVGLSTGNTYYYRVCATDNAGNRNDGTAAAAYIPLYRHVCPACQTARVQDAIDAAGSGDIIKLAEGTYHENILIEAAKDLTIIGGYDASFSDPPASDPSLTILDGDSLQPYDGVGDGRVLSITTGSNITLENLTIMNGYAATGQGGGIWATSAAGDAVLELKRIVIRNNAAEHGGGVYASAPDALRNILVIAQNSFMVENAADRGGGIFLGSSGTGSASLSLLNCTVAENRVETAGSGAGVYAEQTGGSALTDLTVVNSIIWGNRAKDTLAGDDIGKAAEATVTAFFSDIGSGAFTTGAGVMNEDPVFINPAFYNYRINVDSPAVNQGTPAGAPLSDFEGQNRDANPDIGADEYGAAEPLSVKLLSLNGGEIIQAGMPYDITWEAPAAARSFKVFYSINNGMTWRKPTSADVTPTGNIVNDQRHFRWNVPVFAKNKKKCMVKVVGFSGLNGSGIKVGRDRSDRPFAIAVARIITPNGDVLVKANTATAVRWATTEKLLSAVAGVKLSYTTNGGRTWKPMILQYPIAGNPGEAVWITPALTGKKTRCKIKIKLYDRDDAKVGSGSGDGFFAIEP